jgi:hypothetical protein
VNLVIRLKRGSVISGNVTNADGDRVADLPVYLLRSEFHVDGNRLRMIEETTTDPEGYYAFEYLAPTPIKR